MNKYNHYNELSDEELGMKSSEGDEYASMLLGYRYLRGKDSFNWERGIELLEFAADKELSESYVMLANAYKLIGCKPKCEDVIYWLNKADQEGDFKGTYYLAFCYQNGECMDQSYDKAYALFEKAYQGGHVISYYYMVSYMIKGRKGFLRRAIGMYKSIELEDLLANAIKNELWETALYGWDNGDQNLYKTIEDRKSVV